MPENRRGNLKKDYLTIPIEAYICDIILRKYQKLTELEKLTLKFIHKKNSLKDIIKAFNADTLIMNNILTNLFYRGLIQLNLNQVLVYLDGNIIPYVENNTLDEYIEEASVDDKYTITIVQEKIMGEIFTGSVLGDYTKNPGATYANYFDLTANPPDSYIGIQNYSLNKYVKCIRKDLRSDPQNIVKINWLKPIHLTSLYIPLIEKDGKKQIHIDYEYIPRHIQKAWQYAYEREFEGQRDESLDFFSDEPYFLSNKNLIIYFFKELILYTEDLKKLDEKKDFIGLKNIFKDLCEDFKIYLNLLKDKIYSLNDFQFCLDKEQYVEIIKENLLRASDFIIISSPLLEDKSLAFFLPILQEMLKKKIKVVLLYGNTYKESIEENKELTTQYVKQIVSNLKCECQENLCLIQSRVFNNANFILIDYQTILYNNASFLSQAYEDIEFVIPTIVVNGGNIPLKFLEFSINLLPHNFKFRSEFEKVLLSSNIYLEKTLNREKVSFISSINKELKKLKSIHWDSVDTIIEIIETLKNKIKNFEKFDTISTIINFEHRGILIDAMRELSKDYILITDIIYSDQIGPNFKKYIKRIPNFSLIINTKYSEMHESKLNIALSKLDNLKDKYPQLEYFVTQDDYILNILAVKDGFIIFSNERFFSTTSSSHRTSSSSIGLVINTPRINSIIDTIKESLDLLPNN